MLNLLYVLRSKGSLATATKEKNISFVKEVFNGRPLDYSVISYVKILKSCDMKF